MDHLIFDGNSHPVIIVKFVFPFTSISWFPHLNRGIGSDVSEKNWFWMEESLEDAIEKMVHTWGRPISMNAGFVRYLKNGDELYELLMAPAISGEENEFIVVGAKMPNIAKEALFKEKAEENTRGGVVKLLTNRPKESQETGKDLLDQRSWLAFSGEMNGALRAFHAVNLIDVECGIAMTQKIQKVMEDFYEGEGPG